MASKKQAKHSQSSASQKKLQSQSTQASKRASSQTKKSEKTASQSVRKTTASQPPTGAAAQSRPVSSQASQQKNNPRAQKAAAAGNSVPAVSSSPRASAQVGAQGGYVPSYQVDPTPPKSAKKRARKAAAIAIASVVGVLAVVYFAGVLVFTGRFFPHTMLLDMDISGKTPDEVQEILDNELADYKFKVEGFGINLTLDATDMGMSLESGDIAEELLSEVNAWAWPLEIFETHDNTEELASTFTEAKLAETLQEAVEEVNEKGTSPKNASVAYEEEEKEYVVVPEEEGDTLLSDVVIEQVKEGTVNFAPKVVLTDEVLAHPEVTRDDARLVEACKIANSYVKATVDLRMHDETVLSLDEDVISEYISIGEDFAVSFDMDSLVGWVKKKVNAMDTTGASRTYTRPDGKKITVEGGDYGWITDSQATADAVQKALEAGEGGTIDIVMKTEAAQAPDKNGRDFGNRFVDVDLSEQHARFYDDDGEIIWESDIVSGLPADGRNTPTGVYYLKSNDGASTLRGYNADGSVDYETKVTYWMPFKDNSVGFHDASWQAQFGGDWYKEHGSHGCVNLPTDKAKKLHELIKVYDAVVVHD